MATRQVFKKAFRFCVIACFFGILFGIPLLLFFSNLAVKSSSKEQVFASMADVPERKAAVVMGCAKTLASGRRNLYFIYRINAAVALFEAGKCEYLIVSGDNSTKNYDEPTDMRDALIERGIPEERVYRDYAGFRTLDSVVRAREIFGQEDFIVVSQGFHNERAVFIAKRHGLTDVVGFNAKRVSSAGGMRTRVRESFARVKTILDVTIFGTGPKFLGEKVALGGPVT
ncbi:MAG: DUF218 domain-containing protein [Verrucomicrobiales bacterium]|nr:DUF218 domain-containing protein [Verrucomicrobiales bacterium]